MCGRKEALLGAIGSLLLACGPGQARAEDRAPDSTLGCPGGVAVDDSGNVYVCGHPHAAAAKPDRTNRAGKPHQRHGVVAAARPAGGPRCECLARREHGGRRAGRTARTDASWVFEDGP